MLLITGFGPFKDITDNPSAEYAMRLAAETSHPCTILPVSEACRLIIKDEFVKYSSVLMIGVAAEDCKEARMELAAKRPEYLDNGPLILPCALNFMQSPSVTTVMSGHLPLVAQSISWHSIAPWSVDAGNYWCNNAYYEALLLAHYTQGFPTACLFVHVPRRESMPVDQGMVALRQIIGQLEWTNENRGVDL